jgi:hypothetical protein
VKTVNIQTTEKVSYNVVATAKGTSGHASVPLPDNVLAALARAVSRVDAWKAPVKLNETTRLYFERLSRIEPNAAFKTAMVAVSRPGASAAQINAAAAVLSKEPLHNAVLRTGHSLTLMNGGIRNNVIPSEASATFNTRVLPNDDVNAIVAAFNRVGAEKQVTFALTGEPRVSPPVSPVSTALYRAMDESAMAMVPGHHGHPIHVHRRHRWRRTARERHSDLRHSAHATADGGRTAHARRQRTRARAGVGVGDGVLVSHAAARDERGEWRGGTLARSARLQRLSPQRHRGTKGDSCNAPFVPPCLCGEKQSRNPLKPSQSCFDG